MRCEEVRPLLAELAEGNLREAGEVERHLASCGDCSAELGRYRTVVLQLAALRDVLAEPAPGFLERVLAEIPERNWRSMVHRVASDERLHYAVFSVGGAVVGATAIALLWWRAGRRSLAPAGPPAAWTAGPTASLVEAQS
jgi:putative zinc finger protein